MLLLLAAQPAFSITLNAGAATGTGSLASIRAPLPLVAAAATGSATLSFQGGPLVLSAASAVATGTLTRGPQYGASLPLLLNILFAPGTLGPSRAIGTGSLGMLSLLALSSAAATATGRIQILGGSTVGRRTLNSSHAIAISSGVPGYGNHRGFAGMGKMANGSTLFVYREGSEHASSDGNIVALTGTRTGADTWTFTSASIIRDVSKDCRDLNVIVLASGRVGVIFNEITHAGYTNDPIPYVMWSDDNAVTWQTPVRINTDFPDFPVCAGQVVEAPNGHILAACWGYDGDPIASQNWAYCRISRSTDGGASFQALTTLAPRIDGYHFEEPNLAVLSNGEIMATIRCEQPHGSGYYSTDDDSDAIWGAWSSDNGQTWTAPTQLFTQATGKPAVIQGPEGDVICMFRDMTLVGGTPTRWTYYRQSWDLGRTWGPPQLLDQGDGTVNGNAYVYGQLAVVGTTGNEAVGVVWAREYGGYDPVDGGTQADTYFRTFTAPAITNQLMGVQGHASATGSLTLNAGGVISGPGLTLGASGTGTGSLSVTRAKVLSLTGSATATGGITLVVRRGPRSWHTVTATNFDTTTTGNFLSTTTEADLMDLSTVPT